jgi:hypothetical protein
MFDDAGAWVSMLNVGFRPMQNWTLTPMHGCAILPRPMQNWTLTPMHGCAILPRPMQYWTLTPDAWVRDTAKTHAELDTDPRCMGTRYCQDPCRTGHWPPMHGCAILPSCVCDAHLICSSICCNNCYRCEVSFTLQLICQRIKNTRCPLDGTLRKGKKRRAVGQAVSSHLPIAAARFRALDKAFEICSGQGVTGARFFQALRFCLLLLYCTNCSTIISTDHTGLVQ